MHHTFDISDCALRWIASYLDKRTQFVRLGGTVSATTMVMAVVPQRLVLDLLDPALFICYTSEIIKIIVDSAYNLAHSDDPPIHGHISTSEATRLAVFIRHVIMHRN